jgi:hypothetical protein
VPQARAATLTRPTSMIDIVARTGAAKMSSPHNPCEKLHRCG